MTNSGYFVSSDREGPLVTAGLVKLSRVAISGREKLDALDVCVWVGVNVENFCAEWTQDATKWDCVRG